MNSQPTPSDPDQVLNERLDIHFALQATGLGVWEMDPITRLVRWDTRCRALYGLFRENAMRYEEAIQHIHPEDVDRVDQAVRWAMNPQSGGYYEAIYRTLGVEDGRLRWVRFSGRSYFNDAGEVYRFAGVAQAVTQEAFVRQQQLEASEARFRSIVEQAPMAIGLLRGRQMLIETGNAKLFEIWGKEPSITGRRLLDALPEIQGQGFMELLEAVYDTGEAYLGYATLARLVRKGKLEEAYFDFVYTPLRDASGVVTGVMVLATEVTQQVLDRQALEASEAKFRTLIEQAPVATCVFAGRQLVVELANRAMLHSWGKGDAILHKPLAEALPELAGQPFLQVLDQVFTTGEPYHATAERCDLVVDGQLETFYFDFTYLPLFDEQGQVYAILDMATDVTEQVMSRRKLEESEEGLRGAIELAELGTWQIDLSTGLLEYSERLRHWCGIAPDEIITIERAYQPIRKTDRPLIKASITHAITPGTNSRYDVEYTVEAAQTGQERILHAQGKAYVNERGQAYTIRGTVQDVTEQRKTELALAQQVEQRTQQLQASILDLQRSNENLNQFAYIASHDLQEPLRKVQSFSNLLRQQYGETLGENGRDLLRRLEASGARMSALIRDLLTFSRISTRQAPAVFVSLEPVVSHALETLALRIAESGAQIRVDTLPAVAGDASQLEQLFQNLLSNALKFRRTGPAGALIQPQIGVSAYPVALADLPPAVKPARSVAVYQCIEVTDNGIGFEQKYTDRIFQVFQRLHGRNEFDGTGVGLAICEKVAVNHGGAITATSHPGQGACFRVYLPA